MAQAPMKLRLSASGAFTGALAGAAVACGTEAGFVPVFVSPVRGRVSRSR